MEITGMIKKILIQKYNDWGRYKIDSVGKNIFAVGIIPTPSVGLTVTLSGEMENSQYGTQFKITSVISRKENEFAGIKRFLMEFVGTLGEVKSQAIIDMYKEESLNIFDDSENNVSLLSKVKGIKEKTAVKAVQAYQEAKHLKGIVLFLNGAGTVSQVEKIYETYGDESEKILKANPYKLITDIKGFGFAKADALALASGIKTDSLVRLMAALTYVLRDLAESRGHCYLNEEDLKTAALEFLAPLPKCDDISQVVVKNAVDGWSPEYKEKLIKVHNPSAESLRYIVETVNIRKLISPGLINAIEEATKNRFLVKEGDRIYDKCMYEEETYVAQALVTQMQKLPIHLATERDISVGISAVETRKNKELANLGKEPNFSVTEEQRDAIRIALNNRVSVISGGPGRGKTAITEIATYIFSKIFGKGDCNILMLAPTGRAAQRLTESTGYPAMTIHRMLGMCKKGSLNTSGMLIICDESSMINISLMAEVLSACADAQIIFVGDVDQIASIGPGKVLKDIIDSGVIPVKLLKTGHRNSGSIAENAAMINAGISINNYIYDEHFVYIPSNKEGLLPLIIRDYKKKITEYGIQEVMLCAAMKDRGDVAVNKLNERLQQELTSGREEIRHGSKIFRPGDRVMQTRNNYKFEAKKNGQNILGVFNGERGTVAKVGYNPETEDPGMIVVFDDGKTGFYEHENLDDITLAYATTLHKCQGSEAACMMMVYTYGDYMLLNRSLFYTGETRAKKEFRFYGEEQVRYGKMFSAFDIAVRKNDDAKRNTWLKNRIIDFSTASVRYGVTD